MSIIIITTDKLKHMISAKTPREHLPHPSIGDTRNYFYAQRDITFRVKSKSEEDPDSFTYPREQYPYPSKHPIRRLNQREEKTAILSAHTRGILKRK